MTGNSIASVISVVIDGTRVLGIGREEITVRSQLIVIDGAALQRRKCQARTVPVIPAIPGPYDVSDDRSTGWTPEEIFVVDGKAIGEARLTRQMIFGVVIVELGDSGCPLVSRYETAGRLPVLKLRDPSSRISGVRQLAYDGAAAILERLPTDQEISRIDD
jgi:hypothetical protein